MVQAVTSSASRAAQPEGWAAAAQQVSTSDFLRLLTVQLRYQNPLEPMKETEFVAQLAQFSELEATRNIQSLLERQWQAELRLRLVAGAASLIGRQVVLKGQQGETVQGSVERLRVVDGQPHLVVNGGEYPLESLQEVL